MADRWSYDVVLADGSTARIRLIGPADRAALAGFHSRQPPEAIYRRYFSVKASLSDDELDRFTTVDPVSSVGLVAEDQSGLIGWGVYHRWPGRDDADVAFMVDHEHGGRGIATLLLEHLATVARAHGITRFTAETMADNREMLGVFVRAGWPVHRQFDSGLIDLYFDLAETDDYIDTVERREQRADSRSVARLLLPRSVAIIGASDRPGSIGDVLWRNARSFDGPVYAVNPNRAWVGDQPCLPSITAVDDDVWLAVVAAPAHELATIIAQCAAKRVRGAVVVTALEHTDLDVDDLVELARSHGMRIVGPSSMGIASNAPGSAFQFSLAPAFPAAGPVAISMQSGPLGSSLLMMAERLGMGLSWFVSLGDRTDLSGNDLLQFFSDDASTRVVAMYTESFGNPRKFARIARRVARTTAIVAVNASASAEDPSADALFQQAGVIRVPTVASLLDTARTLATQPLPALRTVAVISNARSPMALARQALEAATLVAVPLALDVDEGEGAYASAIARAGADPTIGSLMVIYAPPVMSQRDGPLPAIDEAVRRVDKPVVAVTLGSDDGPLCPGSPVPRFTFPEPAAFVLGRLMARADWLAESAGESSTPLDAEQLDRLRSAVAETTGILPLPLTFDLLAGSGLKVARTRLATTPEAAVRAATEIGYPVALKALVRAVVGRSARAGVALDLGSDDAVRNAFEQMREALGLGAQTVLVQEMSPPGVEVRVSAVEHDALGMVVEVGLGGVLSAMVADRTSRLVPLSASVARAALRQSRVSAVLAAAGLPDDSLVDLVVRVAQVADELTHLSAVELNPVMVASDGCWVVDATVVCRDGIRPQTPTRYMR